MNFSTLTNEERLLLGALIRLMVRADGQLLTCEPASSLPMAQRYFLF